MATHSGNINEHVSKWLILFARAFRVPCDDQIITANMNCVSIFVISSVDVVIAMLYRPNSILIGNFRCSLDSTYCEMENIINNFRIVRRPIDGRLKRLMPIVAAKTKSGPSSI